MKIQRFFYGMVQDKIVLLKTEGVNAILSDASLQFLRQLTPNDNKEWWLPTEQIVALCHIEEVEDGNGRTWVQNQTLLIPIHDYIRLTQPHTFFHEYFEPTWEETPKKFESIEVKET